MGGRPINTSFIFPPFELDPSTESLSRPSEKIYLRTKSFAVLRYLVERPKQLVTKQELLRAVWPQTRVVDAALKVSILEIRKVLEDDARLPNYIETVGRRGYRFIAPVSVRLPQKSDTSAASVVVGRHAELQALQGCLDTARKGRRQIVFVTGEPGIGKTTLVEVFLKTLRSDEAIIIARGQCIEQYGAGEAYMPILDALETICRGPAGAGRVQILRRYAPSWLVNLPALTEAGEHAELVQLTMGVTPERRLREITAFFEAVSADQTLVIALEDLHWLDPSTLALLSFLARKHDHARLLLIGTYRQGEIQRRHHPLKVVKEELELHDRCVHLPLLLLDRESVAEYLAARFETPSISKKFVDIVHRHSEGNPLFMVNMTDYLIGREAVIAREGLIELAQDCDGQTPGTITQLIQRQFEELETRYQTLLEIASVTGMTFSAAIVASTLTTQTEDVETDWEELVKQEQFIQRNGSIKWPDGTISAHYSFIHALYQNVIYCSLTASRRAGLHQVIGERLEAAYKDSTEEVAAELGIHFERCGDYKRAVKYIGQSARRAMQRNAYHEAINYSDRAIKLLESVAESPMSLELKARLKLISGVSFASLRGYASDRAQSAFSEAEHFTRRIRSDSLQIQTLAGLWSYHLVRGELRASWDVARKMLSLAHQTRTLGFRLNSHMAAGLSLFQLGNFSQAHEHLEISSSEYNLEKFYETLPSYSWDPGIVAASYDAMTLYFLGLPIQAERKARKAVDIANQLPSPFHPALANGLLAMYYTFRGNVEETLRTAEISITISAENSFHHWLAVSTLLKGSALARMGQAEKGLELINEGLANWMATGAEMLVPTYLMLEAEAYLALKRCPEALNCVEKSLSLSKKTGESIYDAELYRVRGEILLKSHERPNARTLADAESAFIQSLRIAKLQKAKSLQLKAALSLCRLEEKYRKKANGRKELRKVYDTFIEGFRSPLLRETENVLCNRLAQ